MLFLHPSAEFRGADRVLLQLVAAVDRERWTPVVAIPRRGPLIGELEALGATVEVGPLGVIGQGFGPTRFAGLILGIPRALAFVAGLVRRHRPAVVHTHTLAVAGGAIAGRLVARGRHVMHVHRVLSSKGLRARCSARIAALLADTVVASSAAAKGALERLVPALSERTRLVRNCADAGRVIGTAEGRARLRAQLGVEDENSLVVLIGRLEERKGHRLLIEAAANLRYTQPDARFLIVGDPSTREPRFAAAVTREIESRGLEGIVTRLPHQSDMASVYAAADVVCIPSLEPDRIQSVALEAMAAGRPVIAAAHPGTDEYVRSGGNGLFFESGDVERLTWCLQTLVGDAPRRATMGRAALETHQSEFLGARFKNEFDRVWSISTSRAFVLPGARARIIHLSAADAPGGELQHVVHHLAEAQTRAGLAAESWVVTDEPEGSGGDQDHGRRHFRRGFGRGRLPRALRAALDELDTTAIVHLHGAFDPLLASAAKRLRARRIPYVLTPRGAFTPEALAEGRLGKAIAMARHQRSMLRGARAIQALSGQELLAMEPLVPLDRMHPIPNGAAPAVPAAPAALDPTDRSPILVHEGGMDGAASGLDVLLDGFARHVVAGGSATLWIIGDGPDRSDHEARAEELGVARRVKFLGTLDPLQRAGRLLAANAFVRASRREAMPTAALEAGAAGLPLLITPGTQLDGEVLRWHAGHVIEGPTPDAVAAVLAEAEREHVGGQLAQRGQNAAGMTRAEFTWDGVAAMVSSELYGLEIAAPVAAPAGLERAG